MKNLLTIITLIIFFTSIASAAKITIPVNQVSLFVGSFSDLEARLKVKILDAAIEECGSLLNASIGRTHIKLDLQSIYTYDVFPDVKDRIIGAYPQVGAQVNISCFE